MASESVVNVLSVVRELRAVGQQATLDRPGAYAHPASTSSFHRAQLDLLLVPSRARSHAEMQTHALMQCISAQICIKA